jgi:hypothetical protein
LDAAVRLWHNHVSAMSSDGHRSTLRTAGLAGRSSFAGSSWRFYAWRFI